MREARMERGNKEQGTKREKTYNGMYIQELTTTNNPSQPEQGVCGLYLRLPARPSRGDVQYILEKLIGQNSSVLFSLPGIQLPVMRRYHTGGCYR